MSASLLGSGDSPHSGQLSRSASATNALWGHLLHHKSHTSTMTKNSRIQKDVLPPIGPVDKAGTSVRMLLHDTQAMLEKFSTRVDNLGLEVESSRKEVATSHKVFQHGHEKLIQEQIDLVNRCQTQIQRTLGTPAQDSSVIELQQETRSVSTRLDAMDRRIDAIQMLGQTTLQALQVLTEQQGKLLTSLTPVAPLIQAIPLHIDSAKNDLKESIREASKLTDGLRDDISKLKTEVLGSVSLVLSNTQRAPLCQVPLSPVSSPSSSFPRKRQRTMETSTYQSGPRSLLTPSQTVDNKAPSAIASSTKRSSPSPISAELSKPRVEDFGRDLGGCSQLDGSQLILTDIPITSDSGVLEQPNHSSPTDLTLPSGQVSQTSQQPNQPDFAVDLPLAENTDRSASVLPSGVCSPSTTPTPTSFPGMPVLGATHLTSLSPSAFDRLQRSHVGFTSNVAVKDEQPVSDFQRVQSSDLVLDLNNLQSSATKVVTKSAAPAFKASDQNRPISLKERRARDVFPEFSTRDAGKRFISVDDMDEDELDGELI